MSPRWIIAGGRNPKFPGILGIPDSQNPRKAGIPRPSPPGITSTVIRCRAATLQKRFAESDPGRSDVPHKIQYVRLVRIELQQKHIICTGLFIFSWQEKTIIMLSNEFSNGCLFFVILLSGDRHSSQMCQFFVMDAN